MRIFLVIGAIAAGVSVLMGAAGAHMLPGEPDSYVKIVFEKAVRYQMYHSLALVFSAFLINKFPGSRLMVVSAVFFVLGIVLFSGSLYMIALASMPMGLITPAGGISFVLGWFTMALGAALSR